jgi:hypothetical protein
MSCMLRESQINEKKFGEPIMHMMVKQLSVYGWVFRVLIWNGRLNSLHVGVLTLICLQDVNCDNQC